MNRTCKPWGGHSWGPQIKRWDGDRRGVITIQICSSCGGTRRHPSGRIVINRGRYVLRDGTRGGAA